MNVKHLLLFPLIFLLITSRLTAQEDNIVIVSPRVGTEIDREERDQFYIFQKIKNFVRATVFVTPKDSFYILVRIGLRGGESDTVLNYKKSMILLLSERIDHLEEIIKGNYTMGTVPAKITMADGRQFAWDSIQLHLKEPTYSIIQSDLLPFTGEPLFKENIPKYYFGIGRSTYSPDFDGLRDAFIVTANRYKNRIYNNQAFTPKKPVLDFSPLMWFTFSIKFAKEWTITGETSDNEKGDDIFRAFSVSLNYHPTSWGTESLHPFVGAGFGRYFFSTTVPYHVAIDSVVQNWDLSSTTTFLEKIDAQGGANGILLTGGCDYDLDSHYNLQATFKYLVVPELHTTLLGNIPVTVFLGSIMFGAQFRIVF